MTKSQLIKYLCALSIVFGTLDAMRNNCAGDAHATAAKDRTSRSSASSTDREAILKISAQIDAIVMSKLKSGGKELNEPTSDEVFLRRAYVDIAGRIPTLEETRDFLRSNNKNKRAKLIDRLLDSYGYVSRQYNFWADILRIKSTLPVKVEGVGYIEFVKDSLEKNTPYDKFVYELLTSEGPNLKRGNGAVGYYLRDRLMPEDNMSNTVRVFLGTRLECAQCHDHPDDEWTQRQYYEMVAFSGGIKYKTTEVPKAFDELQKMLDEGEVPGSQKELVKTLKRYVGYGVAGRGTGLSQLPVGYLGEDGSEGDFVFGKTIFDGKRLVDGEIPPLLEQKNGDPPEYAPARDVNSREAYARWLTSPQNPKFAKVIANRLWKQAMGVGLFEPVDVIDDSTIASNPELMDFLEKTILDLKFDMKQFLRTIYNSQVYQAASFSSDVQDSTKYDFEGPLSRRMSAEQIWDSLVTLTVDKTDERYTLAIRGRWSFLGNPLERYEKLIGMNAQELKDVAQKLEDWSSVPAYVKAVSKLDEQLENAKEQGNSVLIDRILAAKARLYLEFTRKAPEFARASEQESPAPAGHFLRELGQSERERIEAASTAATVSQALSLMNGYVEKSLIQNPNSVMMQIADCAQSARECTELVFLSMLNRMPTSEESQDWINAFGAAYKVNDRVRIEETYKDLIWVLANSNEFVLIQ